MCLDRLDSLLGKAADESVARPPTHQWTAVTRDGKRSAQFEEMLLVTETGVEVITAAQPQKKAEVNGEKAVEEVTQKVEASKIAA